MTNRQWTAIWTEIALAYETPPKLRTDKQYHVARGGLCGACLECDRGGGAGNLMSEMCWCFGLKSGYSWIWCPFNTPESDHLRATFAAMFAAMTIKEFKEMIDEKTE